MPGGWKKGKGGKKKRATPKSLRQLVGAGRNAKGAWKAARSRAAQLGIKNVRVYGR